MKDGNWRINRSESVTPEFKRSWYQKIRLQAINALGGKCVRCNFLDERALQIDHVDGGGVQEYKKYSGTSFYYHVLKEIAERRAEKYQILCANCNVIKRREKQECPLRPEQYVGTFASNLGE